MTTAFTFDGRPVSAFAGEPAAPDTGGGRQTYGRAAPISDICTKTATERRSYSGETRRG
jgi:hypothetical protein